MEEESYEIILDGNGICNGCICRVLENNQAQGIYPPENYKCNFAPCSPFTPTPNYMSNQFSKDELVQILLER